jgi:hypothetical protein
VLFGDLPKLIDFLARESTTPLNAQRIEPELRLALVPFNVDMRWFGAIARIKEEPERSDAQNSRHLHMLV